MICIKKLHVLDYSLGYSGRLKGLHSGCCRQFPLYNSDHDPADMQKSCVTAAKNAEVQHVASLVKVLLCQMLLDLLSACPDVQQSITKRLTWISFSRFFILFPAPENEEQQRLRFQVELEFVQCLGNPNYLNCKFPEILYCLTYQYWDIDIRLVPAVSNVIIDDRPNALLTIGNWTDI